MDLALAPEIRRGDHACGVFASDDDQASLVGRFAADAFARGDRLFFLADRADVSTVTGYLDEAGLHGRERLDAGDVQVMHSSEMGFEDGFDPEVQIAAWANVAQQACADGYGGLAAAAEMTWTLSWGIDADALVGFETASSRIFSSGQLAAICMYDRRLFGADVVERARCAHPYGVALGHHSCSIDFARMSLHRAADRLAIGGEIDLASVGFLEAQLHHELQTGDVTADCSEVAFIDVAGCRLLRRAAQGQVGAGRLRLDKTPPTLARVMSICEWADGTAA